MMIYVIKRVVIATLLWSQILKTKCSFAAVLQEQETTSSIGAKHKNGKPVAGDFDSSDFGGGIGVGIVEADTFGPGTGSSSTITVVESSDPAEAPQVFEGTTARSGGKGRKAESRASTGIDNPAVDPPHSSESVTGPVGGRSIGQGTASSGFTPSSCGSRTSGHGWSTGSTSQNGGMTTATKTGGNGEKAKADVDENGKSSASTKGKKKIKPGSAVAPLTICFDPHPVVDWNSFEFTISVFGKTFTKKVEKEEPDETMRDAFADEFRFALVAMGLIEGTDYNLPPSEDGKFKVVFLSTPVALAISGWATGTSSTSAVTVVCPLA